MNTHGNSTYIKKEIKKLHSNFDLATRLYASLRLILSPIVEIEKYVPEDGFVLDLGCGSGIFANILSIGSPERRVFGVDMSESRVKTARKISQGNPGLKFVAGDVNSVPLEKVDTITLVDLLHHMPYGEQDSLINKLYGKLNEGGILLIKDLQKAPYWKYIFHYIQDSISYKGSRLYFRSSDEMKRILENAGFKVETISLDAGYPHPHVLYKCQKK